MTDENNQPDQINADQAAIQQAAAALQEATDKLEADQKAAESAPISATTAAPAPDQIRLADALDKAIAQGIAENDGNPDSRAVAKVIALHTLADSMIGKSQAERDAAAQQLQEGA